MAQLPILNTERTIIRPFSGGDITEAYIGWLNDPEVVKFSQQRFRKHDENSCVAFYKSFEGSNNHFSAIHTKDDLHIGNVSTTIDTNNSVADIAIMIGDKSYWGQGYGLEIWAKVMEALFSENIRLVTGGCMVSNIGMVRLMENAGMSLYYVRKNYFLHQGSSVDSVHYVMENEKWK